VEAGGFSSVDFCTESNYSRATHIKQIVVEKKVLETFLLSAFTRSLRFIYILCTDMFL